MSKMNGPTRKKWYVFLVKRDRECCKHCDKCPPEVNLVVDHRDNNNDNNSPENLQLLCRRCNYLKNPRRPLDSEREYVREEETELQKSNRTEPLFRKFVFREINELREVPRSELINSGAEDIEISPLTTGRYLDKMCSSRGLLERVKRVNTTMIRYKDEINT